MLIPTWILFCSLGFFTFIVVVLFFFALYYWLGNRIDKNQREQTPQYSLKCRLTPPVGDSSLVRGIFWTFFVSIFVVSSLISFALSLIMYLDNDSVIQLRYSAVLMVLGSSFLTVYSIVYAENLM